MTKKRPYNLSQGIKNIRIVGRHIGKGAMKTTKKVVRRLR